MKTEFECRFTDIDVADMRNRVAALGFKMTEPEHMMLRKIYMLPRNDAGERCWLRLRDQGDKTTLTFKTKGDLAKGCAAMKEMECDVGDFKCMGEILEASGFKSDAFEENLREKWEKDKVEICFDTWPGLDTFMEIEADCEELVKETAAALGLDFADAMFGNAMEVYEKKLGLTIDEVHASCTFDNPPRKKS